MKIFRCNSINFQLATRDLFYEFHDSVILIVRKECSSGCTARLYCLTPSSQIYALYK